MINVTKAHLPSLEKYMGFLNKIWDNHWLTNNGPLVQLLCEKLETYLNVNNVLLLSNGTLALQLALRALKIKGEVITTPFTFAATTNVLMWEGLTPVFADIDPETFNIDTTAVISKISRSTSAILAVHVFGNPCYINDLETIAKEYDLKIIYDAAHAFGVQYNQRSVLDYGDVSTLSFHATKVFNTIEGGAVISKNHVVCDAVSLMRNHGIKSEDEILIPGINAKMNEFQAAMGLCNLEDIDLQILKRKRLYEYYKEQLSSIDDLKFQKIIASKYNYSYMPVLLKNKIHRDNLHQTLLKNGIKSRKYFYPLSVDFDYYGCLKENLIEKYDLFNSRKISDSILCLPLYPELEQFSIDKIIDVVKDVCIN